jgi:hypothetical protein
MIIFPSTDSVQTKQARKYYPSFDPTALDGFYSIFNRPYESNYSYDGDPAHGDNYKPRPSTKISSNPFLASMGDFGTEPGQSNAAANESTDVSFIENGSPDLGNVGSLSAGRDAGKPDTLNTMVNLATSYATGGIGGKISAVTGLIGLISGLFSGSNSSDDSGIGDGPGGADGQAGDVDSSDSGSTGAGSDIGSDNSGGDGTGSGGSDGSGDSDSGDGY